MKFSYTAKKISGEEKKGEAEAKDRFELAKILREEGFTLISAKEKKNGKKGISISFAGILGGVSISEKMIFCRNFGVMIGAGISAPRALEVLSRQTKIKKFQKTILEIADMVQKGSPLSESMAKYPKIFSSLFVAMVKVGEESGKLSDSLKTISDQLEKDHTLRRKVRGAMMYPSIIMIAMIIIAVLMLIYVVPTLVSTFKELGVELPMSTKIVIFLSDFLANNILLFLVIVSVLVSGIVSAVKSKRGKRILDTVFLHLPIFSSLVKKFNTARTSRTLSSLMSSGVDIIETLNITQEVVQNHHFKNVIEEAKKDVQKGTPVSESFKRASNLYPALMGEMIAVGEETGKISEMLSRLADFYEEEVSNATKDLSTVIEPILMVVIGAFVGFFAISMIKPMYSMMNAI